MTTEVTTIAQALRRCRPNWLGDRDSYAMDRHEHQLAMWENVVDEIAGTLCCDPCRRIFLAIVKGN